LSKPRLYIPDFLDLEKRLNAISFEKNKKADIDLSMFFHSKTESEIVNLQKYLSIKKEEKEEDFLDNWIRMIATNRLTGHSKGFFSVYTLPPNQAVSPQSQLRINQQRNQKPEYRNVKEIILKKTKMLLRNIDYETKNRLLEIAKKSSFYSNDARETKKIKDNTIQLTVTSPPFLNIVQYAKDNWLRCWFNKLDINDIEKK